MDARVPSSSFQLKHARTLLRMRNYLRAVDAYRKLPSSPVVDVDLAKALYSAAMAEPIPDEAYLREASHILVRRLLQDGIRLEPGDRRRLLRQLQRVAAVADPTLAQLLSCRRDGLPLPTGGRLALLRHFFLSGAACGATAAEKVLAAKEALPAKLHRTPTLQPVYTIEFAKRHSSYTPLLDVSDDGSAGGGYFLQLHNRGCVVDPGHHFIANFLRRGRRLADIDGIIVTHFHDDHYADLPALLSLLYQLNANSSGESKRIRVLLDATTRRMFSPLIDGQAHLHCSTLSPGSPQRWELTPGVFVRALPTQHDILPGEGPTGVGLDIEIQPTQTHLIITGDTGWFDALQPVYEQFRGHHTVLVAHVSSVSSEEAIGALTGQRDTYYHKHLCVHGLCRVLEAAQPAKVILSEIGEELRPSIARLARLVRHFFRCECSIGTSKSPPCELCRPRDGEAPRRPCGTGGRQSGDRTLATR